MTSPKFAKLRQLAITRGTKIITPKAEPGKMQLVGYYASWINERRN